MNALTSLNPQSPNVQAIHDLWVWSTIILGAIFIIVTGIVIYALMRFRWNEGEADPHQVAGHKGVELTWTVIPFVIVILLFVLTARTMSFSDPAPAPKPDLIVVGHRWWWEARYPQSGIIVANEIHIPVGKALSVQLDSTDVLHEFWVAELARKMTTVPGHPNHIWIQADKPGTYLGVCSEYCGTQHAWMRFLVVAQTPSEYAAWEAAQLKPAPASDAVAGGAALFQSMSCVNCHAIDGTNAKAHVGPDLSHFASRQEFGSGIAKNTTENLRKWLENPQQVKPGVLMPNFNFTEDQLNQMVAYLQTLK